MANNKIAGSAIFKVDGDQFTLGGSMTISVDPFEREAVTGLSGVGGYKEMFRAPFIEIEALLTADFPVERISQLTDVTVTAELATERTAVLRNAWLSGTFEANAADGTTTLRFEGLQGEWLN